MLVIFFQSWIICLFIKGAGFCWVGFEPCISLWWSLMIPWWSAQLWFCLLEIILSSFFFFSKCTTWGIAVLLSRFLTSHSKTWSKLLDTLELNPDHHQYKNSRPQHLDLLLLRGLQTKYLKVNLNLQGAKLDPMYIYIYAHLTLFLPVYPCNNFI